MSEVNPTHHPIYMDHNATTPVDPRVLDAMLPYFTEIFGNAASIDHIYGAEASQAVEKARAQVASLIKAQPEEIVFTSGATESNNLAILGIAEQLENKGKHLITCVTEHKAVLDVCKYLEGKGWQVTYLPVDCYGLVDPEDIRHAITPKTILISIMTANNEIGTIAPIMEIGKIAREHDILFHTDASQAVGHLGMDIEAMNIDLLSLSAHKIYGPKGVGALYVRKRRPRVRLVEQMHGGGHERGMRSGTLNVPCLVGLGKATEIAMKEREKEGERVRVLRDKLWEGLQARIDHIALNGHPMLRLPNNLSIAFSGVESRSLLVQLKHDLALSTGSACTSAKVEPSHVILSLGYGQERAFISLRFGLGRGNNKENIETTIIKLHNAVDRLRSLARF